MKDIPVGGVLGVRIWKIFLVQQGERRGKGKRRNCLGDPGLTLWLRKELRRNN